METQSANSSNQQRQGRIIFLLMTIFFVVPIIVVITMYKLNWKPAGQSNGELLSPPRLLVNTEMLKTSEGQVSPKFWAEKWNMVYVTKACEQACKAKLHLMRQLHVSLYKDMMRAQRVLITTSTDVADIKKDYPDMVVINQPSENIMQLSNQFNIGNEDAMTANRLYLVDPLGHIVMSYKPEIEGKKIRKDFVRLLSYSWAG
jgi:hypothetical protein